LTEIRAPLPAVEEQERVVDTLDTLLEDNQRLESIYQRMLAALEVLKKSLLHQAFTGNFRLSCQTTAAIQHHPLKRRTAARDPVV
jgi:restriction endonuclease S subunit